MYANANELRMPARYADMTEVEMEYDGCGFFGKLLNSWKGVVGMTGGAVMVVGGIGIAVGTGYTGIGILGGAAVATGGAYLFYEGSKELLNVWTN